jgi:hypothetical protein
MECAGAAGPQRFYRRPVHEPLPATNVSITRVAVSVFAWGTTVATIGIIAVVAGMFTRVFAGSAPSPRRRYADVLFPRYGHFALS